MLYQKNRICLFGGAFNPIHNGHLIIADQVRELLNLDKIIFVPSGNSPFKDTIGIADHRLEMINLAINKIDYFEVSDFEIKKEEKTYSIDTVKKFKDEDIDLFFLVGEDAFSKIENWKDSKELMDIVTFIVSGRHFEKKSYKEKNNDGKIIFVDTPIIEISSTDIRNRVKNNKSINFLTNDKVIDYIKRNKLYV